MGPTYYSTTADVFVVQKITQDVWNYGWPVNGGSVSISQTSPLIAALADTNTNVSGYFLETGPIVDQSFAGGSPTTSPSLYIGGSDYSTIFVPGTKETI